MSCLANIVKSLFCPQVPGRDHEDSDTSEADSSPRVQQVADFALNGTHMRNRHPSFQKSVQPLHPPSASSTAANILSPDSSPDTQPKATGANQLEPLGTEASDEWERTSQDSSQTVI